MSNTNSMTMIVHQQRATQNGEGSRINTTHLGGSHDLWLYVNEILPANADVGSLEVANPTESDAMINAESEKSKLDARQPLEVEVGG